MPNTNLHSENTNADSEPINQVASRKRSSDDNEEGTRRVAQRTDTIAASVSSMQTILLKDIHSSDFSIVLNALLSLMEVIKDDDDTVKRAENQAMFVKLGGHALIVVAMEKNRGFTILLNSCLLVLIQATYNNDHVKRAVAIVKGIEAVVSAMRAFPLEKQIIWNGFLVLWSLSGTEDVCNQMIHTPGIAPFIVGRMKHFLGGDDGFDVNLLACKLLKNLCVFQRFRTTLINSHADVVLGEIYKSPSTSEEAKERLASLAASMLWL